MITDGDLSLGGQTERAARIRRAVRLGLETRSPHLRRRLGAEARDEGRARFGPSRHLRRRLYDELLAEVRQGNGDPHVRIGPVLENATKKGDLPELSSDEREEITRLLGDEVDGLGPLAPLFSDPTVSDILINGFDDIWVDRFGCLEPTDLRFDDTAHLKQLLDRWVTAQGRRLDELCPYVDLRLPDGSRLNALIPPISGKDPVVSIRRLRAAPWTLEQLRAGGCLSRDMCVLLEAAVVAGLNVVISGGSGAGKTSLLSAVARAIPESERLLILEETPELRLDHPHVVHLEARPANAEGQGEVSLRDLVRNALRMRADRLIVGEVRGVEVFDMLQAMNTGHGGSLTTVHANSPPDTLKRLQTLVLLSGFELPARAAAELLGAAFDLIVHVGRFPGGRRRITSIHEVICEGGRLGSTELFRYQGEAAEKRGLRTFSATGNSPTFETRLREAGAPASLFEPAGTSAPESEVER